MLTSSARMLNPRRRRLHQPAELPAPAAPSRTSLSQAADLSIAGSDPSPRSAAARTYSASAEIHLEQESRPRSEQQQVMRCHGAGSCFIAANVSRIAAS